MRKNDLGPFGRTAHKPDIAMNTHTLGERERNGAKVWSSRQRTLYGNDMVFICELDNHLNWIPLCIGVRPRSVYCGTTWTIVYIVVITCTPATCEISWPMRVHTPVSIPFDWAPCLSISHFRFEVLGSLPLCPSAIFCHSFGRAPAPPTHTHTMLRTSRKNSVCFPWPTNCTVFPLIWALAAL